MALFQSWKGLLCVYVLIVSATGWHGIAWSAPETPPPVQMPQAPEPPESTPPDSPDATPTSWHTHFNNRSEVDLIALASIRKDELQWSIAGNSAGTNPNILSEVTWSNVQSYQVTVEGRAQLNRIVFLRGNLNYGWIQSGRVRDSDYNSDDRQDEYSRSISHNGGDQVWDFSLGAGYPFLFAKDRLLIAPLLGYSYHVQNLRITDGKQVVTWESGPPLGTIDGLNSTYRTRWMGPWLGCDLRYRIEGVPTGRQPMELGLSLEIHWTDYEAEANWNLRGDLDHPVSFEHAASGMGYSFTSEWLIELTLQWDLAMRFHYQYYLTDSGKDRIHYVSGDIGTQQLNEVEWKSHSYMLGVTYHF
jgi:hypothetical protein